MKTFVAFLILIIATCFPPNLSAQKAGSLYIDRDYQNACARETRQADGQPGKNYFQNRADYRLKADYNPETHILKGNGTIRYDNNSRDSLGRLCFNLFQNRYRKGATGDSDIDPANLHDGAQILSLKVDGTDIPASSQRTFSTILAVYLKKKIAPGSACTIEIEWSQKMPVTSVSRQGTYHGTSQFIAYWYPKLCVYDDLTGWNTTGYFGKAEFHSDYADYRVEITVPARYTVWSSGRLTNAGEVFQPEILAKLRLAEETDTLIRVITEADRQANRVTRSAGSLTWNFVLDNRMDFAFGISDTYIWDATSTVVDNLRVPIHSVYLPESSNCSSIPSTVKKAIHYYSENQPKLNYPEPFITFFEGGPGGMEFPCMVNQQNFSEPMETMMVTIHELGHAYMPFYCGINEQKYGWIDEGIFSMLGFLAFCDQAGDKDLAMFNMLIGKYGENAGSESIDLPILYPSYQLGDFAYGYVTYVKPAAAFFLLHDYLGADRFNTAIRAFMVSWKDRHPTPYDLFSTINRVSGEDLSWFWKSWFFAYGYADLAIGPVEKSPEGNRIRIDRKGSYPAPIHLTVKYINGTEIKLDESMACWKTGQEFMMLTAPAGEIGELLLNPTLVPDADFSNNRVKPAGTH